MSRDLVSPRVSPMHFAEPNHIFDRSLPLGWVLVLVFGFWLVFVVWFLCLVLFVFWFGFALLFVLLFGKFRTL